MILMVSKDKKGRVMSTRAVNNTMHQASAGTALSEHEYALLKPVMEWGRGTYLVLAICSTVGIFGLYAYATQLREGLVVTGMRDQVSWGLYITNFVFFIGISHVGALLSSILRLTGAKWRYPITRMAEAITFAALLFGALMPLLDLGRPERIANLISHGRLQSPILWDILSITTYLVGSSIFLYLPLIPDLALMRDKLVNVPGWRRWLYRVLAMGWKARPEQHERLEHSMNTMAVLILPIAIMVHTVVSWIFAMTLRPGWNSTIFGPYFVAGALASGAASVVLAMAVFRRMYHLETYITPLHFRNMAALVLVLDLVYLYFNLAEYATAAYKMELGERALLMELFTGRLAPVFWFTQVVGLIVPAILLMLPSIGMLARARTVPWLRPIPLGAGGAVLAVAALGASRFLPAQNSNIATYLLWAGIAGAGLFALSLLPRLQARPVACAVIASGLIVLQAWLKRYIIVVPVLQHPYLSSHEPALGIGLYQPTWVEWGITAGAMAGFVMVYFLFSRLFPIVSVWETEQRESIQEIPVPVRHAHTPAAASPEV
ncbi:MAG: polysulfide reductase NrfD [Chloroflexi bacterium]|nr:polysulfide reductase NrfD [Chloroflexota bacterium]